FGDTRACPKLNASTSNVIARWVPRHACSHARKRSAWRSTRIIQGCPPREEKCRAAINSEIAAAAAHAYSAALNPNKRNLSRNYALQSAALFPCRQETRDDACINCRTNSSDSI